MQTRLNRTQTTLRLPLIGPDRPRLGVGEGAPEHLLAPGAVEADGHEHRLLMFTENWSS